MSMTPGATTAFKPSAAPAAGIKPQQIGGVKFPGKIDPSKTGGMKLAAPSLPMSALSNPALGAMFGLLFGRVANTVPGLRNALTNPAIRDAAIGASIASALAYLQHPEEQPQVGEPTHDPYNPRPAPMSNGWRLQ